MNNGNGVQRKPGCGEEIPDFLKALKVKVAKDPTISMHKMASELDVDLSTVRMAIHDDLGLKSYARIPWHLLTKSMKARETREVQESAVTSQTAWFHFQSFLR